MYVITLGGVIFISTFIGCIIGGCFNSDGWEFVNPFWIYKRIKVNWFGAALISLLFNLITLPCAILYWVYKLCTVGRKDNFDDE